VHFVCYRSKRYIFPKFDCLRIKQSITIEEKERLEERFYRVDKNRSRELGGTGLGLAIVKHLMIAHGGKMEITSQLGQGAKVALYFPSKKAMVKNLHIRKTDIYIVPSHVCFSLSFAKRTFLWS